MVRRLPQVCPDCPAARQGTLEELVGTGECALRCRQVGAREPLPARWFGEYGLALVRRGVIVRQRVDADGSGLAIDVVGPGGAVPLSERGSGLQAGYAVDDALVCLCPRERLREAVDGGAPTSGELLALHAAALERVERIAHARCRPSVVSRVATLLGVLAETLSPPRVLNRIPPSLQLRDFAALLAVRHESVCRAMKALARQGAIIRTPEGVTLADPGRLARA